MGTLDKRATIRKQSKIVQIPSSATIAQMETALDKNLNKGWHLNFIFNLSSKTYALFVREF